MIIAEAATNHYGNIEIAKRMIKQARLAGAKVIKFQSWQIKNMKKTDSAYEFLKRKELTDEMHYILIKECERQGIKFLTTCFDIGRINFLKSLGLDTIKVASPDLSSYKMLNILRDNFRHIILSTGMCYERELKRAVDILKRGEFTLLHCVSIYPAPLEELNLARINWLYKFTDNVGYSDHSRGVDACKVAIAMGAKIIEKHFTLKRVPSNIFSIGAALPKELREICEFEKGFIKMFGRQNYPLSKEERKSRKKYIGRWGNNR